MFEGKVRFLFAIMLCFANMIIYGLKVNISTAIMGMVKLQPSEESGGSGNPNPAETSTDLDGPFHWTTTQQGLVVSIYFAGYLVGMFPAGYFADRFNTKMVLLICILANAILTLLVPMAAPELPILLTVRFFTGLVSSANLPVINVLLGKWVVFEEKSMWAGIIYAGVSIGTVISILTSGLILKDLGWEAVFYIHGALPLLWCIFFYIFFADCPEEQKYITEAERSLLINSYGHRSPFSTKAKVPWKAIFTSKPMCALVWTNMLGNFCWYFLLTQMPLYMNKVLRYDITSNSVISCLPYLINSVTNPMLGKALDWGRKKDFWTQTGARKIAVGISCIPSSIFLIIIMYVGTSRMIPTVFLVLSIVVSGAIFVGHLCNQNDLAPNYAGILMGITNTPGTLSAFILPALVGALTEEGHTMERWRIVFWINIAANITAFFIFLLFGSGQIQPWNDPQNPQGETWDARRQETKM